METRDPEVRLGKIWACCLAAFGRRGKLRSPVCVEVLWVAATIRQLDIDRDCGWLDVGAGSSYHEEVSVAPTIGNGLEVVNSWQCGPI
jgi:hypothetical protein